MGVGVSIFLITLGAILRWAVKVDLESIDFEAIGIILMIVGAASLVLQVIVLSRVRPAPPGLVVHEEVEHLPPPVPPGSTTTTSTTTSTMEQPPPPPPRRTEPPPV